MSCSAGLSTDKGANLTSGHSCAHGSTVWLHPRPCVSPLGLVAFGLLLLLGQVFPGFVRVETWVTRISDFMEKPDEVYQVVQSKIAIANGGWLGEGPGNSIQRNYLPSPFSDYI